MVDQAANLNAASQSAQVDRGALEAAVVDIGENFAFHVKENCPHLFASVPYFVSSAQVAQMHAVIGAVERVVKLPAWWESSAALLNVDADASTGQVFGNTLILRNAELRLPFAKGVFFGFDFHLNTEGAHLIEINTNAGGALLNALLLRSQRENDLPGTQAAMENLEQVFLDMFLNEWRLERGDRPLQTVVILDEQPQQQYLYPEFLLAQQMFEKAGIEALIVDPGELQLSAQGVYCREKKIDLIYNRLTDFLFQQHSELRAVFQNPDLAVITPHPFVYACYADKYNLTVLTHPDRLRAMGVAATDIAVLQSGIPQTRKVHKEDEEMWWQQRKQWFFKPASGYGSKGAYRGAGVTKRVFAEIMQGGYVAQRLAVPGERAITNADAQLSSLKSDVRCYVYNGQVQLIAARLYQGQTTNFRTEKGGFAPVRVVG